MAEAVKSRSIATFSPWPYFDEDEIKAVEEVLRSGNVNYWTSEIGRRFEKEFAEYIGCRYAIALANGSVALELALYALGIQPGDEVVVTPRTFIASASSAVLRGIKPVFADIDPDSGNITADTIRRVITPKTKAIITVHLAGWPCDMDSILKLAQEYDLKVIEDCAQAHGACYKGESVGSFGDAAAWSFCQDKIMTTGGEGGLLTTNDHDVWEKAWSYKDHGKSYDTVYNKVHEPGFIWLHESFGTNLRMTEMQSAIGRRQLMKLPGWRTRRQHHASILTKELSGIDGLRIVTPPDYIDHAYYKYYLYVEPDMLKSGWSRDRIMNKVCSMGIPCFSGSCSEIYLEKAFKDAGLQPKYRLPVAQELGETSLMFQVHPTLCDQNMYDIVESLEKVMALAVR